MYMKQNEMCPKTNHFNFAHIHEPNKINMASPKLKLFFVVSITSINTYQHDIVPTRPIWHYMAR